MNPIIKKFNFGKDTVSLETGRIARQATGSVLCSINETSVLCTVVGEKSAKEGMDFFPLVCITLRKVIPQVKFWRIFQEKEDLRKRNINFKTH